MVGVDFQPGGFTIEVHNNNASNVMLGLRVLVGSQGIEKAPSGLEIFGRSVVVGIHHTCVTVLSACDLHSVMSRLCLCSPLVACLSPMVYSSPVACTSLMVCSSPVVYLLYFLCVQRSLWPVYNYQCITLSVYNSVLLYLVLCWGKLFNLISLCLNSRFSFAI